MNDVRDILDINSGEASVLYDGSIPGPSGSFQKKVPKKVMYYILEIVKIVLLY